jgi:CspA family cold shock protein
MSGGRRFSGTVKWFNKTKGWGFIQRDDGRDDLFVHHSELEGTGYRNLEANQRVEFGEAPGKKGTKAVDVKVTTDH